MPPYKPLCTKRLQNQNRKKNKLKATKKLQAFLPHCSAGQQQNSPRARIRCPSVRRGTCTSIQTCRRRRTARHGSASFSCTSQRWGYKIIAQHSKSVLPGEIKRHSKLSGRLPASFSFTGVVFVLTSAAARRLKGALALAAGPPPRLPRRCPSSTVVCLLTSAAADDSAARPPPHLRDGATARWRGHPPCLRGGASLWESGWQPPGSGLVRGSGPGHASCQTRTRPPTRHPDPDPDPTSGLKNSQTRTRVGSPVPAGKLDPFHTNKQQANGITAMINW